MDVLIKKNPLICVMSVDIGNGNTGTINIYYNDTANCLANQFVKEHNLDSLILHDLINYIETNANEAKVRYMDQLNARKARKLAALQSKVMTNEENTSEQINNKPTASFPLSVENGENRVTDHQTSDTINTNTKDSQVNITNTENSPIATVSTRRLTGTEEELEEQYAAILRRASTTSQAFAAPGSKQRTTTSTMKTNSLSRRSSVQSTQSCNSSITTTSTATNPSTNYPLVGTDKVSLTVPSSSTQHHASTTVSRSTETNAIPSSSTASFVVPSVPPVTTNTKSITLEPLAPTVPTKSTKPSQSIHTKLTQASKNKQVTVPENTNNKVLPPRVPSSKAPTDPKLFDRLYQEAEEKRQRSVQATQAALENERLTMVPFKQTDNVITTNNPDELTKRLYDNGMAALARRENELMELRTKLQEQEDAQWVCASCTGTNDSKNMFCMNPSKLGKRIITHPITSNVIRVCGITRPLQRFVPSTLTIHHTATTTGSPSSSSSSSSSSSTPADAVRQLAYIDNHIQNYHKEIQRRSELAKELEEREISSIPFKPEINPKSRKMADKARQKRAAARTATESFEPSSHHSTEFSLHDDLYADAMHRILNRSDKSVNDTSKAETKPQRTLAEQQAAMERLQQRSMTQVQESRSRLAEAKKTVDDGENNDGKGLSVNRRPGNIQGGVALYEAAKAAALHRQAILDEEIKRVNETARSKHTSTASEKLLANIRARSFAGMFRTLVSSMELPLAARVKEEAMNTTNDVTANDNDDLQDIVVTSTESEPTGRLSLSRADLFSIIAALEAHNEGETELFKEMAAVPPSVSASYDCLVTPTNELLLDIDAVWVGCLANTKLIQLVNSAVAKLRKIVIKNEELQGRNRLLSPMTGIKQPLRLVTFQEFCNVTGKLLEEAAGGPHIYMIIKRELKHIALRNELATVAAAKEPTFQPELNPRSLEIAATHDASKSNHNNDSASGDRFQQYSNQYQNALYSKEINQLRKHLLSHPFKPGNSSDRSTENTEDKKLENNLTTTQRNYYQDNEEAIAVHEHKILTAAAKAVMARKENFVPSTKPTGGPDAPLLPPLAVPVDQLLPLPTKGANDKHRNPSLQSNRSSRTNSPESISMQTISSLISSRTSSPVTLQISVPLSVISPRAMKYAPVTTIATDNSVVPSSTSASPVIPNEETGQVASSALSTTNVADNFLSPTRFIAKSISDYGYTPLTNFEKSGQNILTKSELNTESSPFIVSSTEGYDSRTTPGSTNNNPSDTTSTSVSIVNNTSIVQELDKSTVLLQRLSSINIAALGARIDKLMTNDASLSVKKLKTTTDNDTLNQENQYTL